MSDDPQRTQGNPEPERPKRFQNEEVTRVTTLRESDSGSAYEYTEKPGDRIGPYKILELLGEGGFGMVWRAEQMEPVRREVALKVIKPGMDSREIIARFEAERQALALMDHPNIARMFEGGATGAGRLYFAMEYVKGVPITTFCDERKLAIEDRLRLFGDVCAAVQHAHQKAILHRDLKPSNILVSESNGQVAPKVIDFGVAKALGPQLTDKTLFTLAGFAIGTPQYMSPEQAGVLGQDVDTRSDLYSLGVILYELLTGSTPLTREEVRKLGFSQLQDWMRGSEPERPSTRLQHTEQATQQQIAQRRKMDGARLRKRLRGDLDWIVMRAIDRDRNRRYQTVNALAQDLRRYLEGDAVEAGPPSTTYRLGKLAKRYRGALVATGVVLLSILGGMGFTIWQALRATRAEKLASQRLALAQHARDAAEGFSSAAIVGLRKTLIAVGRAELAVELMNEADEYYRKLPAELVTDESERHRASVMTNRAFIASALGRDDEQVANFREAILIVDRLGQKNFENEALQEEAAFARLAMAYHYWDQNDNDALLTVANDLISRCEGWLKKHPRTVWALRYQVVAHDLAAHALSFPKGRLLEGAFHIQAAKQITENLRGLFGETADVCECEGLVHYGNAKIAAAMQRKDACIAEYEAAAASFSRCLELGGDAAVARKMQLGALHNAGGTLRQRGKANGNAEDIERGDALIREAYEGRSTMVEKEPGYAEYWRDLGFSHDAMGHIAFDRKDRAGELRQMQEAFRCSEEALRHQPTSPRLFFDRARTALSLAVCLLRQTPPDTFHAIELKLHSIEDWRKCMEITGFHAPYSNGELDLSHNVSALVRLVAAGDPTSAVETLSRLRASVEPILGKMPGNGEVVSALVELLGVQHKMFSALSRTQEATEAKTAMEKLIAGRPAIPQGTSR